MKLVVENKRFTWIMWVVGIISIFVLTAGVWYKPLPEVQLKECADIDEEVAYEYVDTIARDYSYRVYGSKEVKELGDYISEFFGEQGLEVSKQEFVSWRPDADKFYLKFDLVDNDVNLFSDSYDTLIEHVKGTNVIGVNRGKSEQAILIGAHRDMAYGIQGAEDNASGTGLLMELAKEIGSINHYYTYIFVSFDGEEAQEKGSDYFVKNYEGVGSVKLAIILDQVGFSEADSLMTYGKYGSFEQLSLGTQSLLKECLDVTGSQNVSFDSAYAPKKGVEALIKHIEGKSFITANTDCNPFYEKQIPAFGVKAINAQKMEEAVIHTPEDNMKQVSKNTLKMSGNFVKTMVATLENDPSILSTLSVQDDFVISGDSYLPSTNIKIARVIFIVLTVLEILFGARYIIKYAKKEEIVRCLLSCVASFVWACALCLLLRYGLISVMKKIPLLGVLFIWILLLIAGIIVIKKLILKNRVACLNAISFQQIVNGIAFGTLCLCAKIEYAVVIFLVALIGTLIIQFWGERFKIITIIINTMYEIIHSFVMISVFNVFLRGVNLEDFLIIQIMSLFIFITMNIFVFGQKYQQERLIS